MPKKVNRHRTQKVKGRGNQKKVKSQGVSGKFKKMNVNLKARKSSRIEARREKKSMNKLLSSMTSLKVSSPPKKVVRSRAGKSKARKYKPRGTRKVPKANNLAALMASLRL
jgi:hypothetical protein